MIKHVLLSLILISGFVACGNDDDSDDTSNTFGGQVSNVYSEVDDDYGTLVRVFWTQNEAADARVEFSFDADTWVSTPVKDGEAGENSALLLGIPYQTEVTFRVVNEMPDGPLTTDDFIETTSEPPSKLPETAAVSGEPSKWDPETNYVFLSMENTDQTAMYTIIIDRQGRVVWARRNSLGTASLHPRVSFDGGQLLIDESTYWTMFDGGAGSTVKRMYISGHLIESVETPGLHHPFTDLPDGSIAWPAYNGDNELIQIRSPDGDVETLLDCQAFLVANGFTDYCGSNTLSYDPKTDHFLYSLYSAETVVEIDRATGQAVRHFGHIDNAWGFDPTDSAFWWQHGAYFTPDGNLLVSSIVSQNGSETVVREYSLNETDQVLEEVWSFGEGQGVYADNMGEAHRLPGGNTLHNYGSGTRIREVTPEGEVVWDVDWNAENLGRSVPLGDLYALLP